MSSIPAAAVCVLLLVILGWRHNEDLQLPIKFLVVCFCFIHSCFLTAHPMPARYVTPFQDHSHMRIKHACGSLLIYCWLHVQQRILPKCAVPAILHACMHIGKRCVTCSDAGGLY